MSYQLVIAEKPSVARSIAGVIGADKKQDGYMEGNGYLVSWCIGHLVSLADAGTYDERFKKWRYDDLPILPQQWQYIIPDDKKKQFDTLRSLMERPDVTGLVCATDAGREGELIFRFVYQMAGCKKPFQRLWISSMEDAAIKDGFAHLKPGTDYDNLYQSALCRAQADWLVGINATRLFSILYHKTLTVGRVQTPTLKMLVDREAKISSFQKEKYHIVQIAAGGMEAASERMGNADDAKALKAACETAQAVCVSVTREKKTEQPPRLYDLTTLQREANRLFGFTAKQTLDYAQQLYEKKLLTYPRTDSQYLTDDMLPTAESLVSGLWPMLSFAAGLDLSPQFGRVLNSKKVSDHHAIVPTMEFVQKGLDGLAEGEKKLIGLINRLCEQGYELQKGQMDSFVKSEIESEIAVANAQRQIAQNPAAEPVVTILWSESPHLKDGQQMPLHEAEAVFKELDSARRHEREQPGYTGHWYDKTKFRIDFTMQGQPDSYEGRQDFGDGDGSLIQHIRGYHEYYAQDESWKNHVLHHEGPEAWEADKAQRDMLLHEFVPYMELHCNLAAMEQEARRPLRSGETLTPEQTAYFNAVLDYVKECRPLLNQGQYHLPEPPQLADFDQSLQDYKKQIEAELKQEAAAAGLTVEEYVASDYEAPAQPNFSIYQVPPGPEGRDFRYRSYEDLQADGLSVDRKNYQLVYTAPLDKDTTLDEIYRRFNIEHPSDYKGHSLSTGDIVVFRQDGKQTAYYVDEGADYRQVPEFFAQPEKQLTPDECMTGEQIQTPRGRFYLTDRSREQMEAAGYGFHHQSEDGRYLIMANGTRAFAIPAQQESHIKTAEMSTEQNYNMIDGMMNNAPSMEELEERAKAGEQISLLDVAEAAKAEAKKPKQTRKTTQKQKKPSIRAQLAAAKEEQKKKPPAREKSKEMEV